MKKSFVWILCCLFASTLTLAQVSPLLKKYAGAYYLLNFGEETPNASTEKINLTADGKWTSVSFVMDEDGKVSKVPVKKSGTWKATEGTIQLMETGSPTANEFKWDAGIFLGSSSYLQKIFVSNPVYVAKYEGTFHLLGADEEKPTDFTETIILKADGKCVRSTPAVDDNGVVTKTPIIVQGTWKANEQIIQITFPEEGQERMTEFVSKEGKFVDRGGNYLKKPIRSTPQVTLLLKYAGSYYMLVNGQSPTPKSDKYVLTPDGKGTWTYFKDDGTAVVTKGTWKASEGLIQLNFSTGEEGMGQELLTDFKWIDGAFRAENVYLKKIDSKTSPTKK
ncbi:MAG: hypothetical protein HOP30_01430 [Cyclobacteriaceae bacterium]|nr:hypothetical protein [Cyclobacteriaceae bacterium]